MTSDKTGLSAKPVGRENHPRCNLLGVQVDAVDYDAVVARVATAVEAGQCLSVTALAVHGVMTGALNREQRFRLNHLDLVCPDGQPVRWALNGLYQTALPDRVYGPQLMLKITALAAAREWPVFLLGSTGPTLERLSAALRHRFPNLQLAGVRPSVFRMISEGEAETLADQIRRSGARLVFVGLGCPRQETWVYEFQSRLSLPLIAVGAAFAFHAGELEQAPPCLQRWGLEWLYRLVKEPCRLWRRYLFLNPLYLVLWALQAMKFLTLKPDAGRAPKCTEIPG